MNIYKTIVFALVSLCFLIDQTVVVGEVPAAGIPGIFPFSVANVQPPPDVVDKIFGVPAPYQQAYSQVSAKTPWLQDWNGSTIFRNIDVLIQDNVRTGTLRFHQVLVFGKNGWQMDTGNTRGKINEEYKKNLQNVSDTTEMVNYIKDSRTDHLTFIFESSIPMWVLTSIDHESLQYKTDIVDATALDYSDNVEFAKWKWELDEEKEEHYCEYGQIEFFDGFANLRALFDYRDPNPMPWGGYIRDDNGFYKKLINVYVRPSPRSPFYVLEKHSYSRHFNKVWKNGLRLIADQYNSFGWDSNSGSQLYYLKTQKINAWSEELESLLGKSFAWHEWKKTPLTLNLDHEFIPVLQGLIYQSGVPVASVSDTTSRQVISRLHDTCVLDNGSLYDRNEVWNLIDLKSCKDYQIVSTSGSSPFPDGKDLSNVGDFLWVMDKDKTPVSKGIMDKNRAIYKKINSVYLTFFPSIDDLLRDYENH